MHANYEPIQRWANNAANAAGKALNQGKDFFYSTREKAYDAAREAARRSAEIARREEKRARAYAPTLHSRWHAMMDDAGNHFSRATSHFNNRFHRTESTLLKIGAVFLAYKFFTHRNQPVAEIASDARSHIEKRPVESAILALGIGYALGKLLR